LLIIHIFFSTMKKIIFTILMVFCTTFLFAQVKNATFAQVFDQTAALKGSCIVPQKEIKEFIPINSGRSKGVIFPNSDHRDKVLEILSHLPESSLYSWLGSEDEHIYRCYITNENGQYNMLYTIIGFDSADLLLILFEGGDIQEYKKYADTLRR